MPPSLRRATDSLAGAGRPAAGGTAARVTAIVGASLVDVDATTDLGGQRMLRQRLAPALAAACVAGVLLAPGTALAATPTVAFHGGCGLLGVGASSQPDTGAVTVRSGSTVTFVNHLGQAAHLMINGADRGDVPSDNQVAVLFRQGRVSVSLLPGCLVGGGGGVGSVTVTVTPAADPGSPGTAGSPADRSLHDGGRSPEARATSSAGPMPGVAAVDPAAPAPAGGAAPSADALTGVAPGAGVPGVDPVAVGAAEPGPPGRHRPAGLLIFVAGICVVGVSIAATRAIIAQRAIRSVAA